MGNSARTNGKEKCSLIQVTPFVYINLQVRGKKKLSDIG